jgi:hypothetical protein
MFDDGLATCELGRDEALVGFQHGERVRGAVFLNILENARDSVGGKSSINDAQFEKLAGEQLNLFFAGSHDAGAKCDAGLDAREFTRRGVVVGGAIGVGEFLREDALGCGDNEAGNLGAGIGEHFLMLKLDGLLRLGEDVVGAGRGFLGLVGKFFGGLACVFNDARGLNLGFLDEGGALLLRGGELGCISSAYLRPAPIFTARSSMAADGGLDAELSRGPRGR